MQQIKNPPDLIIALPHAVPRIHGVADQIRRLFNHLFGRLKILKAFMGKRRRVYRFHLKPFRRPQRPRDRELVVHLILRVRIDHQTQPACRNLQSFFSFFVIHPSFSNHHVMFCAAAPS